MADGSFIDFSTAIFVYLKLCGDLQLCFSGVSKMVHIGCHVLYQVLLNLTSDVVLGMDWLHDINLWIDKNAYSLSLDCRGYTVYVLVTE